MNKEILSRFTFFYIRINGSVRMLYVDGEQMFKGELRDIDGTLIAQKQQTEFLGAWKFKYLGKVYVMYVVEDTKDILFSSRYAKV
jgi:hypothetical protein